MRTLHHVLTNVAFLAVLLSGGDARSQVPSAQSAAPGSGRTLEVGPKRTYPTPSAAAAVARDGDTVRIASGEYEGDVAVWTVNRLRIVGDDPRPHVRAAGNDAEGKAIWVVRGADVTIENVEMSGARVRDQNGAAIRAEGRNLTLRKLYLHDNENGVLTSAHPTSEILIEQCEFARNGTGTGQTHNLYVGAVARLTVRRSYFHHAIVGHQLKSRAAISEVTASRFADEVDGRASYEAEFPNGGRVTLNDNVFQKGPQAENSALVSYGAEGLAPTGEHVLVVRDNLFATQRPSARFLVIAPGTTRAIVADNTFAGPGSLPSIDGVRGDNRVQAGVPPRGQPVSADGTWGR